VTFTEELAMPECHATICRRHPRSMRMPAVYAALLAIGLLISTLAAIAQTKSGRVSLATLPAAERTGLEAGLKGELQKLVDRQTPLDGQGPYIRVLSLRIEPLTSKLVIDLSKSFLPLDESYRNGNKYMSGDFQDQMQRFASVLSGYVEGYKGGEYHYNGYIIRIEGRDLLDYYPGDRLEMELGGSARHRRVAITNARRMAPGRPDPQRGSGALCGFNTHALEAAIMGSSLTKARSHRTRSE
jgi:hypothetical protein